MEEIDLASLADSGIVQNIVRTHDATGQHIAGMFRCDLEPGQSSVVLNVPIHPPLPEIPTVEAVCVDSDARIRVTDRQRFGVRLEISVTPSDQPQSFVFVEVVISSPLNLECP